MGRPSVDHSGTTVNYWKVLRLFKPHTDNNAALYVVACPVCGKQIHKAIADCKRKQQCLGCKNKRFASGDASKHLIGHCFGSNVIESIEVVEDGRFKLKVRCLTCGESRRIDRSSLYKSQQAKCLKCAMKEIPRLTRSLARKHGISFKDATEYVALQEEIKLNHAETPEIEQLKQAPYSDASFDPSKPAPWSEQ